MASGATGSGGVVRGGVGGLDANGGSAGGNARESATFGCGVVGDEYAGVGGVFALVAGAAAATRRWPRR